MSLDDPRRRAILKTMGGVGVVGLAGCAGGDGGDGDGGGADGEAGDGGADDGDGATPTPQETTTPADGTDGDGTTTTTETAETLTTNLADAHYPIAIATISTQVGRERGIFAENNLDVGEVTSFAGGGTTVRGIVTGGLGAGKTALPALVQAFQAGAPIYLCGITQATPDMSFHSLADSGIESIQDLSGKTVAISNPGASSEAAAINSVVNVGGISLDDVEIIAAGGLGEAITAAEEGEADVTWALPPVSTGMNASGDWNLVWLARDHAPNITQNVLAMGSGVVDDEPELARSIGHAYVEAHSFIKDNVEEAAKLWGENTDTEAETAVQALTYAGDPEESEPYPPQCYNIELKEEILTTTAETMIEQGLIDEQPLWGDIVRQEVLPEDKRVDWI
jgi:ABC-type nitrate/sulfonate/bicarbonate transport system substrate-binding protein